MIRSKLLVADLFTCAFFDCASMEFSAQTILYIFIVYSANHNLGDKSIQNDHLER